jgi:hypothetical protein
MSTTSRKILFLVGPAFLEQELNHYQFGLCSGDKDLLENILLIGSVIYVSDYF